MEIEFISTRLEHLLSQVVEELVHLKKRSGQLPIQIRESALRQLTLIDRHVDDALYQVRLYDSLVDDSDGIKPTLNPESDSEIINK